MITLYPFQQAAAKVMTDMHAGKIVRLQERVAGAPVSYGAKSGSANFSSVLLGRGAHVDEAMFRLARSTGGHTRRLGGVA